MSPSPRASQLSIRVSINAPSARAAALALSEEHINLAQRQGLHASEALSPERVEEINNEPHRSVAERIGELENDLSGPVAGFWATLVFVAGPAVSGPPSGRLADFTVERLPEPHRDPIVYGGYGGSERSPESIREETLAYWEALDLRALIHPAPSSKPPAL